MLTVIFLTPRERDGYVLFHFVSSINNWFIWCAKLNKSNLKLVMMRWWEFLCLMFVVVLNGHSNSPDYLKIILKLNSFQFEWSHLRLLWIVEVGQNLTFFISCMKVRKLIWQLVTNSTESIHNIPEWLAVFTVGFTCGSGSKVQTRGESGQIHDLTFQIDSFSTDAQSKEHIKWSRSP